MGQMQYKKRNDYSISEIEKKYSNEELLKLILFDNLYNYPEKLYFPERLCEICNKKPITKENQLSGNRECLDCYDMIKKENYEYILKAIEQDENKYEGDCILENKLHLGSIQSSFLKDELKKLGVTHILMVGYFMTPLFPEDFTYENIEINDNCNENILKHLVKGVKFIDQSNVCYTHCQLGKSRSASFAMAYVMFKNKMHFSEAFDYVRKKRPFAFPNEGFQWQLEDFDIIMNNFDYDLDKCDEFIKSYFEKRESLKETEKEYLEKRMEEEREKMEKRNNFINEFNKEEEDNNEENKINKENEEKEGNTDKEEQKIEEKNDNIIKNELEEEDINEEEKLEE